MSKNPSKKNYIVPRPFLKWAGGKTQLLSALESRLPSFVLETKVIDHYVEPFVGGGALFFFLKRDYDVKKSLLLDINPELVMAYQVIQKSHKKLLSILADLETEHLKKDEEARKKNYYSMRQEYNRQMGVIDYESCNPEWILRTAFLIFLNKTCFNGLFRLNSKGEFNVPFGRYKNPGICDELNINAAHQALKKTELLCADFTSAMNFIEDDSLVYLDPPYRPINSTSHFTGYSREGFCDEDQNKLAYFFKKMDKQGANLILSNSDPKNYDKSDNFFDDLYRGYTIERVPAKRNINSKTSRRGEIKELIIRNFH